MFFCIPQHLFSDIRILIDDIYFFIGVMHHIEWRCVDHNLTVCTGLSVPATPNHTEILVRQHQFPFSISTDQPLELIYPGD